MTATLYIGGLECLEYGKWRLTFNDKNKKYPPDLVHMLSMWVILELFELSLCHYDYSHRLGFQIRKIVSQACVGININFGLQNQ
jgi:hypothetical protein